ncbi:MFS transporter [Aureimonas leprariae]|uniref:MFS transporter n=1 Tax=Plantimonas leprariae TaxID=2615207 RepID=A0A7V7PSJ2_9HYPH|nr:MFS transporter [Aureimonas leprariae]KAB0682525.1 MFS transporter [Aureimonas leprariae]
MLKSVAAFGALLLATFLMMVGAGLASALVPLRAAAEGWSSGSIAWIGTVYALAFTAGCILVPILVARVGHIRVFAALQTSLACLLLLLALAPHPLAWMLFRGACGLGMVGGYMVIESWINERTDNTNRGTVFSAYMIVSMVGIASGQFLLPLGDIAGDRLFMASALAFGLALMPVMLSVAPAPRPLEQVRIDPRALFRRSPAAAVGCFVAGVIFGNWGYFGPLYGKAAGLGTAGIATMLTAAMVGGVLFQYPFGRLSDRIDRRYVMGIAGAIGVAVSVAMIIAAPRTPIGVVVGTFGFGTVLFTIYSLSVAHANDQARPGEFVQVSGGLLIVYGVGNMIGPQLGGRLMDRLGPEGFFVAMAMMYAIYGGYALWRSTRKAALPPERRPDFTPVAPMSMRGQAPAEPAAGGR